MYLNKNSIKVIKNHCKNHRKNDCKNHCKNHCRTCRHKMSRKVSISLNFSLKPRVFFREVTLTDPKEMAEPCLRRLLSLPYAESF